MYLFSITKVSFWLSLPKWTSAAAFLLYLPVTHFMSITHPEHRKGGKKGGGGKEHAVTGLKFKLDISKNW